MRCLVAGITVFIAQVLSGQQSLPPVGMWREHLPYNSTLDVTAGDNRIYCATPYSLFVVNLQDNSIERWSRVTGLTETGIRSIRYDEANGKLFIAYSNSNIDILEKGEIRNIPDIKRDNIIGDKTIYNIYPQGNYYFLSTGLGIIVIDGDRYEVKESWFIGAGGNQVRVTGFTGDGTYYYAASAEGLKRAAVNANLPDFSNWQLISGSNGLSPGPCQNVLFISGKLLVQKNDSLFVQNGASWNLFYADGWPIVSSNASGEKIQLCERQANGAARVILLNPDATVARTLVQPGVISFPRKAVYYANETWIADQFGGLSRFSASSFQQYKLNSPEATASGEMLVYNDIFYATAGEVNEAWNYQYNGNGFYIFKEGSWENINRFRFPVLDTLLDFITIAVDRRDETVYAGSYGGGLLEMKPGNRFTIYKQNFLEPAIGDPGSYRVAGLAFDRENNLWISNYGAPQPLRVKKHDGGWRSFALPFFLAENALSQILVDDNEYKWIVSPKGNGLICYDPGASIDNTGDDRWKIFRAGAGNGNLPSSEINAIAKDKNGYIWVGTSDGIAVIQCGQDVFSAQGCEAILPVIQQGNFANYLFKGEEVKSIAIDGADRKWVATKNGAWLVDPAGEKIIYQFNETNSPLLSSDVKQITIDGKTGEVYFATLKGISSFRGTATEGGESNAGLLIFPNPVPPGYSGFISIRGLVSNALVKITELNGRLVWQGRALGGQAVWDGRNYRGQKIASGVYIVLVNDDGRTEKAAGRIVFVAR